MSSTTVNLAIISITATLTCFTFIFETKVDGKITPWGKISIALYIIIFGFSIYAALKKDEEDKINLASSIDRLNTLLRKGDTTLIKIDSSRNSQRSLQDSTRKIDSLVLVQLGGQTKIFSNTQDLVDSSIKIVKKSDEILAFSNETVGKTRELLYNEDRALNSVVPFHLQVNFQVSFDDKQVSYVLGHAFKLKGVLEADTTFKNEEIEIEKSSKNKAQIARLYIGNWDRINRGLGIQPFKMSFLDLSFFSKDNLTNKSHFKDPIYHASAVPGNSNNAEAREKDPFTHVYVDFEKRLFDFNLYITRFIELHKFRRLFGIRDLEDCYFVLNIPFPTSHGASVTLLVGNDFRDRISLSLTDPKTDSIKVDEYGSTMSHKIKRAEIDYSPADSYWMQYYRRTDGDYFHEMELFRKESENHK